VTRPTQKGPSVASASKRIHGTPSGTVGFDAVEEIDDDDSENVVAFVLLQQIAAGRTASAGQAWPRCVRRSSSEEGEGLPLMNDAWRDGNAANGL
jgi:hypothetical protein